MTCKQCNQTIPEDSCFCPYCGKKLGMIDNEGNKENKYKNECNDCEPVIPQEEKPTENTSEEESDFGFSINNPIPVKNVIEEDKYFERLRALSGDEIKSIYQGATRINGSNKLIHIFTISSASDKNGINIFTCITGDETSRVPPHGFLLIEEPPNINVQKNEQKKVRIHRQTKKMALAVSFVVIFVFLIGAVSAFVIHAEIQYQDAHDSLQKGYYTSAYNAFLELGFYRNSEEMLRETKYQEANSLLEKGVNEKALELFEELGDYKDSEKKINEAKYSYILKNYNKTNKITFQYLSELKKIPYKDCEILYENLYEWKITVEAINSSPTDTETDIESIQIHQPIYFHIYLTGGTPGKKLRLTARTTFSDGNVSEYVFPDKWAEDTEGWYGWENGVSQSGVLQVRFYDENGSVIGGDSVFVE